MYAINDLLQKLQRKVRAHKIRQAKTCRKCKTLFKDIQDFKHLNAINFYKLVKSIR